MSCATTLEDKFLGCMVGSALGDAIGELAFFNPVRDSLQRQLAQARDLAYTDDTAMAIALAEALLADGGVSSGHLGDTFSRHYRREPWRGYGPGPPQIFASVEAGDADYYEEAARRLYGGEGSAGNGAAMRVAPLGLTFHDSARLVDEARRSARVTHTHPVGVDGAVVQARAVALAVSLEPGATISPQRFLGQLRAVAASAQMIGQLEAAQRLLEGAATHADAQRELGFAVRADQSLPFAVYCFLRHPASYTECLWCAILHGGDRDTLGAMAGALSGAYLGIAGIPPQWRDILENRDYIEQLASQLLLRSAALD